MGVWRFNGETYIVRRQGPKAERLYVISGENAAKARNYFVGINAAPSELIGTSFTVAKSRIDDMYNGRRSDYIGKIIRDLEKAATSSRQIGG